MQKTRKKGSVSSVHELDMLLTAMCFIVVEPKVDLMGLRVLRAASSL